MTRMELDITEVVSRVNEKIQIIIKLKTKDGFTYTVEKYDLDKNNLSEQELFESVKDHANYDMSQIIQNIVSAKAIWIQHEGHIVATDNIKDVWISFLANPLTTNS